jgi:HPt (histidine-containing phosphotransfer) domain-containing protein
MDMRMPELDGYSATARLRTGGYTKPIIALTAHAMAGDRDKCIVSGCTDYITKPVRRAELLQMVHRHLCSAGQNVPPQAGALHSELKDADAEIRAFLPEFVARLPGQVAALSELLARRDFGAIDDLIHNIKGSGGMYGFARITELAAQAEESVRSGEIDAITRDVRLLADTIRSIEGYEASLEIEHERT